MGWTYFNRASDAPQGPEAENAYLARSYAMEGQSVIASRVCRSRTGNSAVWYAVLETRRYGDAFQAGGLAPEPIRTALVVLIDRSGCWGEKGMDESAGPSESYMPHDLMAHLSPLDEIERLTGWPCQYARDWRERCGWRERAAQPALPLVQAGG